MFMHMYSPLDSPDVGEREMFLMLSASLTSSVALTSGVCDSGPKSQEAPDFRSAQMERQQSGADAGPSGQHDLPPAGSRYPRRDLQSDSQPAPVQRGEHPAESLQLYAASMPGALACDLSVMLHLVQESD